MRAPLPISVLVLPFALLASACGDNAASATAAPSTTNSTGTEGPTTSTGTSTDDTEGQAAHAICDHYLVCISVVAPGELPGAQMGFGESGTCWQGSEEDAQLCLDACKAGLETFHEAFPDEPKCALCQDHAECDAGAGELCYQGKCTVTTCSNGVVDKDEVCDSQPGCDADCLGPSECNPLSNFGCSESEICVIEPIFGWDESTLSRCLFHNDYFFGSKGKPCADDHKQLCGLGLGCANPALLPACEPENGYSCCTPLCILDDPQQCAISEKCVPYQDIGGYELAPELGYLGFCVPM